MPYSISQIEDMLHLQPSQDELITQSQQSPSAATMLEYVRRNVPDLSVPHTPYTLYREFERTGMRGTYQDVYFAKRARLTRAVLEMLLGDDTLRDTVHDLLWSICEETTWLLPAHEEQGPDFWDLKPSPRQTPLGAHTMLTREPDSIDLFAAETGASLAETVYWLEARLAPEVCQRVRREVERHIFTPYLASGRQHWWYKGALNWNGVCNGSVGLAFMRLENDPRTLAEALAMVLEGFEAYIATGFEPDGGSIEGISYWNYGLMYYVTLAELLRETTGGQLDLLAQPRLKDIVRYALGMALSPGVYVNFGDATEELAIQPGIVQKLAERTGIDDVRGLLVRPEKLEGRGATIAKLAITLRDVVWWDGTLPAFPASAHQDYVFPDCAMLKLAGRTAGGAPVMLAAKAGHTDGHHSHTDIGSVIYHIDGESLLCDPGRGLYSRGYFRQARYDNVFCNSIGHSVPTIGGHLQVPGPEFGGRREHGGTIVEHGERDGRKLVVMELRGAYPPNLLRSLRRTLLFDPESGELVMEDLFEFAEKPLDIEEACVSWYDVEILGKAARILGTRSAVTLTLEEPTDATWKATLLEQECRDNQRSGVLTRLAVHLPDGASCFRLRLVPD